MVEWVVNYWILGVSWCGLFEQKTFFYWSVFELLSDFCWVCGWIVFGKNFQYVLFFGLMMMQGLWVSSARVLCSALEKNVWDITSQLHFYGAVVAQALGDWAEKQRVLDQSSGMNKIWQVFWLQKEMPDTFKTLLKYSWARYQTPKCSHKTFQGVGIYSWDRPQHFPVTL